MSAPEDIARIGRNGTPEVGSRWTDTLYGGEFVVGSADTTHAFGAYTDHDGTRPARVCLGTGSLISGPPKPKGGQ